MDNRLKRSFLATALVLGVLFVGRVFFAAGGHSDDTEHIHAAETIDRPIEDVLHVDKHQKESNNDHRGEHGEEGHDDNAGIDLHDEDAHDPPVADDHGEGHEDELELTEEQQREIGLIIDKAGPGSLHSEVSLSGEIRLNEDTVTHIVPRVSGIAVAIKHSVGDQVQAGDVLAVLESAALGEVKTEYFERHKEALYSEYDLQRARTIKANTDALLALLEQEPSLDELLLKDFGDMGEFRSRLILGYTELLVSRKAFERKKSLFDEKIASENALLEVQNTYEKAKAEYLTELDNTRFENRQNLFEKERLSQLAKLKEESAERQLRIFGLSDQEIELLRKGEVDSHLHDSLTKALVIAPQAGTIIEKHINRGERVDEDSDIFTIADLSSVWVDLKVPARDIHLVQPDMDILMESPDGDKATAKITVSMPLMDEETRTATVRAVMDNEGGHWKPGAFVTGHVRVSAENLPIILPLQALQSLEGKDVIFVAHDHGFKARAVITGRRDHTSVEIISGIEKGEPYVTQGAFELKAMTVTSSLGSHAGHGH
jgi:cobalt-zinc-cadmium efflux system membrane fusion protein